MIEQGENRMGIKRLNVGKKIALIGSKIRTAFHDFFLDAAFQKFCIITLLIISPACFVVMVYFALITGEFSMLGNPIEDLGSSAFTAVPLLFDSFLMVLAFLLIAPILRFEQHLVPYPNPGERNSRTPSLTSRLRTHLGSSSVFCFFAGLAGILGTAYFSEDRNILLIDGWGPATQLFSLLAFAAFITGSAFAGIIILGWKTIFPKKLGAFMLVPSILGIFGLDFTGPFVTYPFNYLGYLPFVSYFLDTWLLSIAFAIEFASVFVCLLREQARKK